MMDSVEVPRLQSKECPGLHSATQSSPNACSIRHLGIISGNYPAPGAPAYGTFVRQFAREVTRQGVRVSVIAPVARHLRGRSEAKFPKREVDQFDDGVELVIYRPRYLSASAWSSLSSLGRFSPTRITDRNFTAAARRAIRMLDALPDAFYGHFLYFGGVAAVRLGKEFCRPSFPVAGEGVLWTVDRFGDHVAQRDLERASGIIANNSHLAKTVSERLRYPLHRIRAIPNGADTRHFRPRDKVLARRKFRLPADKIVVGAVGNFTHEKGIHRVAQAIDGIAGVAGAFAGSGPLQPRGSHIAFCARVPHDEMPVFLSACDVFVLPTLVEGSSNATIEAMACGLPIIGSDLWFNDDILDGEMAIRVDPMDIDGIRAAVVELASDAALSERMGLAARRRAEALDISIRTASILEFMEERIRLGTER